MAASDSSVGAVTVACMSDTVGMEPWEAALAAFVDCVATQLRWMLIGSAATAVQGVVIVPGDVDILVHPDTPDTAMYAGVDRLGAFAAGAGAPEELASFVSTPARPLLATADGSWLFGRWAVSGCRVEVARIREPSRDDLLLETVGRDVWGYCEWVPWRGLAVPVVPLEVQLATMVSRGLDQRAGATRTRLAEIGCRDDVLQRAFADRSLP